MDSFSFNWSQYLSISEQLVNEDLNIKDSDKESWLRVAISRAYYSVFCQIRDIFYSNQIISQNKSGGIHQEIINKLKNSKNKILTGIATKLHRLRDLRNKADYDTVYPSKINDDSKHAIDTALTIQSAIETSEFESELLVASI